MEWNNVIIIITCMIGLFVFGRIFSFPLKKIGKLILNSLLGGVLIFLINLIGGIWNFHIGLNVITSVFVGVLGMPRSYFISHTKINYLKE